MSYENEFENRKPTQSRFELPHGGSLAEGNPLMKVREKQITEIKRALEQNDYLVLGTVARSGATSVLENLNSTSPHGKVVLLNSMEGGRFVDKAEDVIFDQEEGENREQVILVIDEANYIWLNGSKPKEINDDYELNERGGIDLLELKRILNETKDHNIKVVFQAHDVYGDDGDGGMPGMEKWLNKYIFSGQENIKLTSMQLETVDHSGLSELFDIINAQMNLPQDLVDAKEEIISLCTVPQQLNLIVKGYVNAFKGGANHKESLESALRSSHLFDELLSDIIRTTARERMGKLLKKVADSDDGSLDINKLSEDESRIIERYKNFHLFTIDDEGIRVNGKLLAQYAQRKYLATDDILEPERFTQIAA